MISVEARQRHSKALYAPISSESPFITPSIAENSAMPRHATAKGMAGDAIVLSGRESVAMREGLRGGQGGALVLALVEAIVFF